LKLKKNLEIMKKLLVILFLFTIAACDENNVKPEEENLPNLKPLSNQQVQLVEASNQFSFNIIQKLDEQEADKNFFISPLSIGYALGMVYNGADGDTKQGIKQTLDFGELTDEEINSSFMNLTDQLLTMDNKVELGLANSIWYKNTYNINPSFLDKMQKYYDAKIEGIDFDAAESVDIINGWIEDKTNDKIKDMLESMPANAAMYLINAIYFNADWTFQFDESATQKEDFLLEDGSSEQVEMMYSEGSTVNYFSNQEVALIDIPYGNKQFQMTILLPQQGYSVDKVWQNITPVELATLDANSDTTTVELYMPKFEMKYKKQLDEILKAMGMDKAFTESAEFTKLLADVSNLFISKVLHQSYLKVDEKGSEAAAATIVEVSVTSLDPGKPKEIKINRPFAFMIREKHTGSILFAGKMINPNL